MQYDEQIRVRQLLVLEVRVNFENNFPPAGPLYQGRLGGWGESEPETEERISDCWGRECRGRCLHGPSSRTLPLVEESIKGPSHPFALPGPDIHRQPVVIAVFDKAFDENLAVVLELLFPDASNGAKGFQGRGTPPGHFPKGRIAENDVG